jgi:ABC-type antimicrobial peptide transport system ATPase subunit
MGVATPALGYGSRTEAAIAMEAKGISRREIAGLLGIPLKNVSALTASGKRERHSETKQAADMFPARLRHRLRHHAAQRGVSVDRLIIDIVMTVADDNLVDAVLDDRRNA